MSRVERTRKIRRSVLLLPLLGLSPVVATSAAQAQATPATAPNPAAETQSEGDIVITAERRSTSLQRTPIAVTAITTATLERQQIRSLADVQTLAPNLRLGEVVGVAQINVRGIGNSGFTPGADGAVTVNLNDIVISRPSAQLAGLFDVSSLEVLRGPQGTLYGRNATAGSLNVRTARPTEVLSGMLRTTVGNYKTFIFEGAVAGPIVADKVLARLAVLSSDRTGYGTNVVSGKHIDDKHARAVRATIELRLTPDLINTTIGEYYRDRSNGAANHWFGAGGTSGIPGSTPTFPVGLLNGGYVPADPRDIASGVEPLFQLTTEAVTNTLEWTPGPLIVRSITGYRHQDSRVRADTGGASNFVAFFETAEPAHQFSQELQAIYSSPKFNLTTGGFYFDESVAAFPSANPNTSTFLGIPGPTYLVSFLNLVGHKKIKARAVFAQANYNPVSNLTLTAGLRYSHETNSLNQNIGVVLQPYSRGNNTLPPTVTFPPTSDSSVTPRLGVSYQAGRTFLYGTYSRGFRSGGYDLLSTSGKFGPEYVSSYEAGVKTSSVDNAIRANLTGFYYKYSDLQVTQLLPSAPGSPVLVPTTTNAAVAESHGIEAEVAVRPVPRVLINLSGSWLHARFKNYTGTDAFRPLLGNVSFAGNMLPNAPDYRANGSVEYRLPLSTGDLFLKAEVDYTSKVFFAPNNLSLLSQSGYAKANLYSTYESNRGYRLSLFVKNIANIDTKASAYISSSRFGNPVLGSLMPPRTFGLELGYKF